MFKLANKLKFWLKIKTKQIFSVCFGFLYFSGYAGSWCDFPCHFIDPKPLFNLFIYIKIDTIYKSIKVNLRHLHILVKPSRMLALKHLCATHSLHIIQKQMLDNGNDLIWIVVQHAQTLFSTKMRWWCLCFYCSLSFVRFLMLFNTFNCCWLQWITNDAIWHYWSDSVCIYTNALRRSNKRINKFQMM